MEEFDQVCAKFVNGFNDEGGDYFNDETHYEDAIQWAIDKVENLSHVEKITIGEAHYPFLVSDENKMALFPSVVITFSSLTIGIYIFKKIHST